MCKGSDRCILLVENMPDAFARHRIILDSQGNPADFVYLDVNSAFEKMTGLTRDKIKGKKATEIFIATRDFGLDCIDLLGKVALTGENKMIPYYHQLQQRWFEISVYSDEPDYFITIFKDISDIRRAQKVLIDHCREQRKVKAALNYQLFHDQLTGLYNRAYMEEEMKRLDAKKQLPVSIIMLDLNGLKLVNDTCGHSAGDEMLRCAAEILKNACREEDAIFRWGGDEFVVILTQAKAGEVEAICKRIKDKCCKRFVENVPVSMALGTATRDSSNKNMADVLKKAEDEMYKEKLLESRSARSSVLSALINTLQAKSYETEAHTRNMQEMALKIGRQIKLSDSELSRLELLITLHDIGKINIPEEILTKDKPLTQEEWKVIRKHPETGYRIARLTEQFAPVAEEILAHHERWDGTGYPRGLKGTEIPLLARITALVDAFEVMTNGRPYKKALTQKEVVAEIKRCAGTQFDPQLVEAFFSVL